MRKTFPKSMKYFVRLLLGSARENFEVYHCSMQHKGIYISLGVLSSRMSELGHIIYTVHTELSLFMKSENNQCLRKGP